MRQSNESILGGFYMKITTKRKVGALPLCVSAETLEKVYNGSIQAIPLYCDIMRGPRLIMECYAIYLQHHPSMVGVVLKNEIVLLGACDVLCKVLEMGKEHDLINVFQTIGMLYGDDTELTLDEIKAIVDSSPVLSLSPNIVKPTKWDYIENKTFSLMKPIRVKISRNKPFLNGDEKLSAELKKNIPDIYSFVKTPDLDGLKNEIKKSVKQQAQKSKEMFIK